MIFRFLCNYSNRILEDLFFLAWLLLFPYGICCQGKFSIASLIQIACCLESFLAFFYCLLLYVGVAYFYIFGFMLWTESVAIYNWIKMHADMILTLALSVLRISCDCVCLWWFNIPTNFWVLNNVVTARNVIIEWEILHFG